MMVVRAMPLIRHFTKSIYVSSILKDGVIHFEGYNTEHAIRTFNVNDLDASVNISWRGMKLQYKLIGRYVWFTEQDNLYCSTVKKKFSQAPILFDSDEIGALPWREVCSRLVKNNKKAQKFISALHATAKQAGDNPFYWWVCKHEVDMRYCKNIDDL
jgi:hypothetical protein